MYSNQVNTRDVEAKRAALAEERGAARSGAIGGTIAGQCVDTCSDDTVSRRASGDLVHTLQSLISQSMNISDRIEGMRERALGSWPVDPKKEENRPLPAGSVGNIFHLCEILDNVFNVQRTHLEALERVL